MRSPALDALSTITLDEMMRTASLQTRLDRKYILEPAVIESVIAELTTSLRRLEIGDRCEFAYETTYFDTDELDAYRGSAFGRRRRFKVRTRAYLDTQECWIEVKTVAGRGHTVKERIDHPFDRRTKLDAMAAAFVATHGVPTEVVQRLRPTLQTRYRRTTLADHHDARMTLDTDLACRTDRGTSGIGDRVLLETKSPGAATDVDRSLWRAGIRPVRVSKYGTGLAAVDPRLPANKWHRTLNRYFTTSAVAAN